MYLGAIGPSILQVVIFLLYIVGVSLLQPQKMPPIPDVGARADGLEAREPRAVGHDPVHSAHLSCARHDRYGTGDSDRSRRHGRGRRNGPCRHAPPPDVAVGRTGHDVHHASHVDGGVHSHRLDMFQPRVPGHGRRALDRTSADRPARRRRGLPDLRQHLRVLPSVLPRLLRDRLHHHSAACAGGRQARHRSGVVRRPALRQHADIVHAPAVRLRAVLPARHRTARSEKLRHLLGRDAPGC